jgi:hypothetical protein
MGYAAMTTYNVSNLGVKGVAKQAAKNTGKVILEAHRGKKGKAPGVPVPASAPLYPEVQQQMEEDDSNDDPRGATAVARKQ